VSLGAPPGQLRHDANGAPRAGWAANGVAVEQSATAQDFAVAIDDAAGGAIVAWVRRSGTNGVDWSVHGHHVLADGTLDPGWTADGLEIATAPLAKGPPSLVPDGEGGAWFVWRDERDARPDIYVQRVTRDGALLPVVGVPPGGAPARLALSPGVPNPTRGAIAHALALPQAADVRARVLDVAGHAVARIDYGRLEGGTRTLAWNGNGEDGRAVPAGIYVFEVRAAGRIATGRVVRL
jgi:hypothetical protein